MPDGGLDIVFGVFLDIVVDVLDVLDILPDIDVLLDVLLDIDVCTCCLVLTTSNGVIRIVVRNPPREAEIICEVEEEFIC